MLAALGLDASGRRRRARARHAARRGAPRPHVPRAVALPGVQRRPRVRARRRVAAADVVATLRGAVGDALEDVRLFDVFTSDAFGPGRRSLAFALRFRVPDRTLTDAEVGGLRQQAIDAVLAAHDAELR